MRKELVNVIAAITISSSVSMAATSAKAATFNYTVPGFIGGGVNTLSGSFTGNPEPSGIIMSADLTAFSATVDGTLLPVSKTNLFVFNYVLQSGLLSFNVVNTTNFPPFSISVNSAGTNGLTGVIFSPFLTGGSATASPVVVTPQVNPLTAVPEPSQVEGLCLASLVGIGSLIKRKWSIG